MRSVKAELKCPNCGQGIEIEILQSGELELKGAPAPVDGQLALALEIKSVDDEKRTIEGYASASRVIDDGDDVVDPGCFKRTLEDPDERKELDAYVGHKHRFGDLPVGIPLEVKEDNTGIFTKTFIHNSTAGNDLLIVAKERMAAGKPMGMSVGYKVRPGGASFESKNGRTIRHLKDAILREYSFTAMPMNRAATVTSVKATEMSAEDRRDEISRAIRERATPGTYAYVVATYDGYVIVREDDNTYRRVNYALDADGNAQIGESVEVVQTWTEKAPPEATDEVAKTRPSAAHLAGLLELELAVATTNNAFGGRH